MVGLVIAAALVTMLTFDWPLVGGDAASGQGTYLGGRPTVIDGDSAASQIALGLLQCPDYLRNKAPNW
ncbi:MAG TPA: hypothetical protein VGM97_15110 [Steroidobacteraceae bacterium]